MSQYELRYQYTFFDLFLEKQKKEMMKSWVIETVLHENLNFINGKWSILEKNFQTMSIVSFCIDLYIW